ncbi:hypothetical protein L7F22_045684 [Adiantum nelumboides]|nr:hypothetical protein [Adiantum nelumboides]
MGKSNKLFKALVSGVKAFKSPSKEKPDKDRPSDKADKDHLKKGSKEKCLWSLGKSSSRNRDSLSAAAALLDAPESKSVQVEDLHIKEVLPTSGSCDADTGYASNDINSTQDKPPTGWHSLNHMKDFDQEKLAAVKIQAAIRCYLAQKRVARALRALVRLQALQRGRLVRRQAAAALRCMQALVRIQALARGRRVRSSELGQMIQKHIQLSRQQKKKPAEGWVSSTATLQQMQAKAQSKQDAVMKRQRALVYAFSEQLNRSSPRQTSSALNYHPDKSYWGWTWLERWMAAQPVGVPHNMAKEQHKKFETVTSKPDADLYPEANERDLLPVKELVDYNDCTSIAEYNDIAIFPDDALNHSAGEDVAAEEKEIASCVGGKKTEQGKDQEENLSGLATADGEKKLRPSPPPPPPPPPPGVKLVPRPSPSSFSQSSPLNIPPPRPQVCMKVVQRPLQTPTPPPPPPPRMNKTKPFAAPESTSFESQQAAGSVITCSPSSPSSKFSHPTSLASAFQMLGREPLSSIVKSPYSAAADLPGSPSVTSIPPNLLPNEFLPGPNIQESNREPLATPTASSRNIDIMQNECDKATISTSKQKALSKRLTLSNSSISPMPALEVLASSPHQHAALRTPLAIPNVPDEEISDSAEETTLTAIEDDQVSWGKPGVTKVDFEEGVCVETKVGNDVGIDLDEPDVGNVLRVGEAIQDNYLTEEKGGDNAFGTLDNERGMEVVSNKHAASPPSRQGQLMEAASPSLPNYMTTTKSSKAKIRSPTQKLDSPNQKSDPPRPRFDASKSKVSSPRQKLDSPKQRRDLSKQKTDSPSQKADSAVKQRHSLSAVEGKRSPRTNKLEMHVGASSKGQLVSLREGTRIDDSPWVNGHSCRLEK